MRDKLVWAAFALLGGIVAERVVGATETFAAVCVVVAAVPRMPTVRRLASSAVR